MIYRHNNRWNLLTFAALSFAGAGIWTGVAFFVTDERYFLGSLCCGGLGWICFVATLSTFGWQMHVDVEGIHMRLLFGFIQYCERWDALRSWRISKTVDQETKSVSWYADFDFGARWPTRIDANSVDFQVFLDDIRIHVASQEHPASEKWPPTDGADEKPVAGRGCLMAGTCVDCTQPPERACNHCGRLFCLDHGIVGNLTQVPMCNACLSAQKITWIMILSVGVGCVVLWLLYKTFQ